MGLEKEKNPLNQFGENFVDRTQNSVISSLSFTENFLGALSNFNHQKINVD